MKYDLVVIGGGLAGLTCGLKAVHEGLSCAVFSDGMSALHFSSGSIDLLGRHPGREVVYAPFEVLPEFIRTHPEHPYAKCGPEVVAESLIFFQKEIGRQSLTLYNNGRENHFHLTALGVLKPTYLSQSSVFNERIKEVLIRRPAIAILNFEGFRDFHPALAAANLSSHVLFKDCRFTLGTVPLPKEGRSPYELRSIDLGRMFEQDHFLDQMAGRIKKAAGQAEVVGLPAVLGLTGFKRVLTRLQEMTGLLIYETPTLPPSLPGMRLDDALKSRFAELGGVFIAGDRIVGGEINNGRLDHVHTRNYGRERLKAKHYVLATGSFFSGGLASRSESMSEPVFDLGLDWTPGRSNWSGRRFLDPAGHPFLAYGVKTDESLRPRDAGGRLIVNLRCAGAVLAGYDPVREGTGGGVAVTTGYLAALETVKDLVKAGS
ncbi:MAG: glycerol-3-phosphate dehydrogenase subunit GlpB [Thermodesulfobacteriota bacterium]